MADVSVNLHPQPYPSSPSIDGLVERFIDPINKGMGAMYPSLQKLFFSLMALEFMFFGLYMALGKRSSFQEIVVKLLEFSFLYYIFSHFTSLANYLLNAIQYLTSGVAGGPDLARMRSPDAILGDGLRRVISPLQTILTLPQFQFDITKIGSYILMLGFYALAVVAAGACFLVLAIQLAIAQVEYKIVLAFAFILFPFSVFKPLEFMAKPTINAVFGQVIKLSMIVMVVSLITSAFLSVINENYITSLYDQINNKNSEANPVWGFFFGNADQQAASGKTTAALFDVMFSIIAASVLSIFLTLQIPALVSSLLGGMPNLSATGLFQNAAAAAMLLRGRGRGGRDKSPSPGGASASSSGSEKSSQSAGAQSPSGGAPPGGASGKPQLPSPGGPGGPKSEGQRLREGSRSGQQQLPAPSPERRVGPKAPSAQASRPKIVKSS